MSDKKTDKRFPISTWAINNRVTVYVIIAIILLGGLFSYYAMPREAFPEIIETKIYVSTANPGNAAEDVEKFITEPLEKEFKQINGVNKITSTTLQDYSIIIVEFDEGIAVEEAKAKVKDKVDLAKAKAEWPVMDNGGKVEPRVFDLNISEEIPILNINLEGNFSIQQLKGYGEQLKDEIERLPEIKEVAIRGAPDKEVKIAVDPYEMAAAKVSFDDIVNSIRLENRTISGGDFIANDIRKNIRIVGEISDPKQLESIVVKRQGGVVYLGDIARISFVGKDATSYARAFGKPVVMLDVKKRSGKNTIEATNGIRTIVADAQRTYLPKTLHISITNDLSQMTKDQVADLVNNIILGVILVVSVLMFFLSLRNAIFVGIAIPISMLMSYLILHSMGITLNTIVLFGLVMGLGMLVDNGIVVVEHVHSLMNEKGLSCKEAAIQGIGELAWPVIASTATTLAAFFPLGLWPGTLGKFMIYFPTSLSIVLFSSLFVALVINATLTSHLMQLKERTMRQKALVRISLISALVGASFLLVGWAQNIGFLRGLGNLILFFALLMWIYKYALSRAERYFQHVFLARLENAYQRLLRFALSGKRAYYFFFGTVLLLLLSFFLVGIAQPKVDFFPDTLPNQIMAYIEFPEGTDIEKTNAFTETIEKRIYDIIKKYEDPDGYNYMVESGVAQVGEGAGNPQTDSGNQSEMPNKAKITLSLREYKYRRGMSSRELLARIRKAVQGYPGVSMSVEKDWVGPPIGYPINLEISGDDYPVMLDEVEKIRDFINDKKIDGIEALKIDVNRSKPGIRIRVDRKKAGALGLSTSNIGLTLRRSLYGEKISTYKDPKDDYDINVRFDKDYRYDENALFNQPVTYRDITDGQLKQVPISTVCKKVSTSSFSAIKRKNLKRVITLYSNVLQGYNANEIVARLKRELKGFPLPKGMSYKFTGEQEEQSKNLNFLIKALLMAVGGIVLILVAQFNSISKPLIIMTAVLMSFIGVLLGLVIFHMDFIIIMAMMGIIALAGVVVNNAIVLVGYIQLLIDRKKAERGLDESALLEKRDYFEAIVEGGRSRLRPVLLTAITAILGLIPLATGLNIDFFSLFSDYNPHTYIGGDNVVFWGPLAWTVIFGLSFATFLTLVIVPVMLYLLQRGKIRFRKKARATA